MLLRHITVPNLVILCQTTSVVLEIRKKLTPRFPPFKVIKVIGTDTDRFVTCDFLLVIHSKHGPISYRLRHEKRYLRNFPIRVYFNAPAEGVHLRIL